MAMAMVVCAKKRNQLPCSSYWYVIIIFSSISPMLNISIFIIFSRVFPNTETVVIRLCHYKAKSVDKNTGIFAVYNNQDNTKPLKPINFLPSEWQLWFLCAAFGYDCLLYDLSYCADFNFFFLYFPIDELSRDSEEKLRSVSLPKMAIPFAPYSFIKFVPIKLVYHDDVGVPGLDYWNICVHILTTTNIGTTLKYFIRLVFNFFCRMTSWFQNSA